MNESVVSFRSALPALLSLAAAIFVSGTAEYVVAGLLPEISSDLEVSSAATGQLITVYALTVALAGPFVTSLTAQVPRKRLILLLVVLFVAGAAVTATAAHYPQAVVGRMLSGLAHAPLFAAALTVGSGLAGPARIGSAIAVMSSGLTLATVLGAPLGTFLGQALNWRVAFVAIAVAGVIALLPLSILLPRQRSGESGSGQFAVLRQKSTMVILCVTVMSQAAVSVVFSYLALISTDGAGFGGAAIPVLLLLWGLGGFIGNLVLGRAADFGALRALRGALCVMVAALLALPGLVWWQPAFIVAILLLGALMAGIVAPLQTLIMERTGGSGFAIAVNVSAFMAGHAVAAALGGAVLAVAALLWIPIAGALLGVVALALVWYLAIGNNPATPSDSAELGGVDGDVERSR